MSFQKWMIPVVMAVFLFPAAASAAQEVKGRYSNWESGDEKLEKMINEVEDLISEGIRSKAAHPGFLRDLQLTVNRYKVPKKTYYLKDDFADNDYLRNPVWTVKKGRFSVDYLGALYSSVVVYQPKAANTSSNQSSSESQGDKNLRVLFGVLNELIKDPNKKEPAKSGPANGDPAQIISLADIPNAFTLQFTLRSESDWGQIKIGLIQGNDPASGYHLIYHAAPSKNRPLQMIKYLRGTPYVVNAAGADSPNLDDGKPHTIIVTRSENGDMVVKIDGKDILQASDITYRRNFSGLAITNSGGKYGIDNIEVFTER